METGDLQFASYCINHIHGNGLLAGQSLTELEQSLVQFAEVNRVIRQEDGMQFFSMLQRTVEALRRPAEGAPDIVIDFGGTSNQIGFDNITVGSATPGGFTPRPNRPQC